jgi:hypothetical protein
MAAYREPIALPEAKTMTGIKKSTIIKGSNLLPTML